MMNIIGNYRLKMLYEERKAKREVWNTSFYFSFVLIPEKLAANSRQMVTPG